MSKTPVFMQQKRTRTLSRTTVLRGILAVIITAGIGYAALHGIHAATISTQAEAENGAISGNAGLANTINASNNQAAIFGKSDVPTTPGGLVTFTGGTSIALRWNSSVVVGSTIKQYDIYRNNALIGSVTPGFHANCLEMDGNCYVDTNVTAGSTYRYQVRAVANNAANSALTAAISATQPTRTTPIPTFTYDLGGATDLDDYMKNTVIPFLQIWYPKVSDYEAFPDYTPYTNIKLILNATWPGYASTTLNDGTVTANTAQIRNSIATAFDKGLAAWLHEVTHSIQGQAGTAGNNAPSWLHEGGADFSREYIIRDRAPYQPFGIQYYTDGYSQASFFINWIQQHYDSTYLRKVTVAGHNHTFSSQYVTFPDGRNLDEAWDLMLGLPSHTGAFKNGAASNVCLDDLNGGTDSGNKIQMYTCTAGSNNQKFTAQAHTANKIINIHVMGGCLDVSNSGTANGTIVQIWNCSFTYSNTAQQWTIGTDGTIRNVISNKCLQPQGGATANGTQLIISDCTGASYQRWTLPAGSPTS